MMAQKEKKTKLIEAFSKASKNYCNKLVWHSRRVAWNIFLHEIHNFYIPEPMFIAISSDGEPTKWSVVDRL